ncbi:hypothetical protein BU26DRAFT_257999 [Trematosphaeria pertusa]|uniref:Uncharacterized protein n=1 Tax=Trematosphaeria pertusa TaxID=390896 RepID=A0A6A6IPP5_9PLEO|nr:uncharacterized protein BU26DRAFT_257999 [Trematosphaeria pertusa]KAF2252514.1 hypothetical protein BU26DRAFT_257999 [Trematosphaeria pertusa]
MSSVAAAARLASPRGRQARSRMSRAKLGSTLGMIMPMPARKIMLEAFCFLESVYSSSCTTKSSRTPGWPRRHVFNQAN